MSSKYCKKPIVTYHLKLMILNDTSLNWFKGVVTVSVQQMESPNSSFNVELSVTKLSLRKIPTFQLFFWCASVVEMHSFRRILDHKIFTPGN